MLAFQNGNVKVAVLAMLAILLAGSLQVASGAGLVLSAVMPQVEVERGAKTYGAEIPGGCEIANGRRRPTQERLRVPVECFDGRDTCQFLPNTRTGFLCPRVSVHNSLSNNILSAGEAVINSREFQQWRSRVNSENQPTSHFRVELPGTGLRDFYQVAADKSLTRATLSTSGLTNISRPVSEVVDLAQQRLLLSDLIPTLPVSGSTARFVRESSFTNAATAVAEEGQKPEATFALEEVDVAIKKIAVVCKVTDELLQDQLSVAAYINLRLAYSVAAVEEDMLINGTGSGNTFKGLLATDGIQTQVFQSNFADSIHKAITKVRAVGFLSPTVVIVSPTDWQNARLAKDGQGQYHGGGPFLGPYGTPLDMGLSIWNTPVIATTFMAQGTAIVLDSVRATAMFRRKGITIDTTNSDGSDFIYNRTAIRCETRGALGVFRPKGICKVTGIPAA